jgi:hypothetical protein
LTQDVFAGIPEEGKMFLHTLKPGDTLFEVKADSVHQGSFQTRMSQGVFQYY